MNRAIKKALGSFIGLVILGVTVYFTFQEHSRHEVRRENNKAARDLLSRAVKCPPEEFANVVKAKDPWGNALVLRDNTGSVTSKKITSKGLDGRLNTTDDITVHRNWNVDWTKVGEKVGKAGGELSRGIVKGAVRSLLNRDDPPEDQNKVDEVD